LNLNFFCLAPFLDRTFFFLLFFPKNTDHHYLSLFKCNMHSSFSAISPLPVPVRKERGVDKEEDREKQSEEKERERRGRDRHRERRRGK
jgi:hypothetical protein